MNVKGIIFDLDGTTLDTSMDLTASANYALKTSGLDEVSKETVISCTGNGTKVLIDKLTPNKSKEEKEKIFKIFEKYYQEHPFDNAKPYENVKEVLVELKSKGYKLCILSNKDDDLVQEIVEHFYPGIFDFITGAQFGIPLKPNPTLAYLCSTSVGLKLNDMVLVGDTLVDYETAKNCKINSIILTSGFAKKETLVDNGVPFLIDNIKELLEYL